MSNDDAVHLCMLTRTYSPSHYCTDNPSVLYMNHRKEEKPNQKPVCLGLAKGGSLSTASTAEGKNDVAHNNARLPVCCKHSVLEPTPLSLYRLQRKYCQSSSRPPPPPPTEALPLLKLLSSPLRPPSSAPSFLCKCGGRSGIRRWE